MNLPLLSIHCFFYYIDTRRIRNDCVKRLARSLGESIGPEFVVLSLARLAGPTRRRTFADRKTVISTGASIARAADAIWWNFYASRGRFVDGVDARSVLKLIGDEKQFNSVVAYGRAFTAKNTGPRDRHSRRRTGGAGGGRDWYG